MKEREINHLLWDIQYEANQNKGYKNNINFKDAFVCEAYVRSGLVRGAFFTDPEFIYKAYQLNTNFLLVEHSDHSLAIQDRFIPSFTTAPIDVKSLENTIKGEYINLFNTKRSFTFSIIHLLPLPTVNDDHDNDWIKKAGDVQIKKKIDAWIKDENKVYLENFLTNEIQSILFDAKVENNYKAPIFFISNIEIDNFNKIKAVEEINVYAGIIDEENKKLHWIKASHDFLEKKNIIHYKPIAAINPLDFNFEDLKEAQKTSVQDNEFLFYTANEKDGKETYTLLDVTRNFLVYGDANKWTFGKDERFSLNDKKIPEEFQLYHQSLYKWVDEVNKNNK